MPQPIWDGDFVTRSRIAHIGMFSRCVVISASIAAASIGLGGCGMGSLTSGIGGGLFGGGSASKTAEQLLNKAKLLPAA